MITDRHVKPWDGSRGNMISNERRLWQAFLLQFFQDLATTAKNPIDQRAKAQAQAFLAKRGDDFKMVCDFAGYPIDTVVKVSHKIMNEGFTWRAAPGEGERYLVRKEYRRKFNR